MTIFTLQEREPGQRAMGQAGFTLLELVIVVAVIGILASIALPSYRQYMIRAHRSDAESQMMEIASREQQYLLSNRRYADKNTIVANGYSLPGTVSQFYTWDIAVGTGTVPSFVITFTATGSQVSDGALTLNGAGDKTPPEKWKR